MELEGPPTRKELEDTIRRLKNNNAPGESEATAEAIKALPEEGIDALHQMYTTYWEDKTTNHSEWQTAMLEILYKNKGDQKALKNFRRIVLQDMFASSIIASKLAIAVKKHGVQMQYAMVGCTDALYVIKSALQLRKEHGLDTHILFVDLVKAYDMANHEILFPLLKKYGVPPKLVKTICKLHKDFKVKFTVVNKERMIDYTVGVHQGDNMALLLFLFLMQAMSESLKMKQNKDNTISKLEFRHHKQVNKARGRLQLQPQPAKTKGEAFDLMQALFVENQALLAASLNDLCTAAAEVKEHLMQFGLIMHVGELNE